MFYKKNIFGLILASPLYLFAQDKIEAESLNSLSTLDFSTMPLLGWLGIALFSIILGYLSTRNSN